MPVHDSQTWRELLGKIIEDPQERQHVAKTLGISSVTLTRWVSGVSKPRIQNLCLLLTMLPEYRQQFLAFFADEFGSLVSHTIDMDTLPQTIPTPFYAQIVRIYCTLPRILRCNTICELVLQQALKQLDPNYAGIYIAVAQCIPPTSEGRVRSLRILMSQATRCRQEPEQFLLGAGTLTANAVIAGRPFTLQKEQHENSITEAVRAQHWANCFFVHPIKRANHIGGCLLISSADPDYFLVASRRRLIQHYAELITLAFEPNIFFAPEQINLAYVPSYEAQYPYLFSLRRRVACLMSQFSLNIWQAERMAFQQIETELLHSYQI
jgi:hypothetical protein